MTQATRAAGLGQALEAVPDAPARRVPQLARPAQEDLPGLVRLRQQPPLLFPAPALPFRLLSGLRSRSASHRNRPSAFLAFRRALGASSAAASRAMPSSNAITLRRPHG